MMTQVSTARLPSKSDHIYRILRGIHSPASAIKGEKAYRIVEILYKS